MSLCWQRGIAKTISRFLLRTGGPNSNLKLKNYQSLNITTFLGIKIILSKDMSKINGGKEKGILYSQPKIISFPKPYPY